MLRAILNDWSLSSIVRFRSGEAFTVSSGVDNNQDGSNNDRANYVGGDPRLDPNRPRSETTRRWFNAAAFAPNAAGQDGNAGRNILDGPGFRNVDLAVFRDFPVRESIRLQFRWELTNAFNMVNLANPTSNLSSRDVGVITSGRAMREMSMGLRLIF
jgi:hypothetical protein